MPLKKEKHLISTALDLMLNSLRRGVVPTVVRKVITSSNRKKDLKQTQKVIFEKVNLKELFEVKLVINSTRLENLQNFSPRTFLFFILIS